MQGWRVRFGAVITLGVLGGAFALAAAQGGGWDGSLASVHRCFQELQQALKLQQARNLHQDLKGTGCPDKIDWTKSGFPFIVANLIVQPDEAAAVTLGDTRIDIPAGSLGPHPACCSRVGRRTFSRMFRRASE